MPLGNQQFNIDDDIEKFNKVAPGYTQFFKVFYFVLFMCAFPLALTGIFNIVLNRGGHNCKTAEEINKVEKGLENLKNHKGYLNSLDYLIDEVPGPLFRSHGHELSSDLGLPLGDKKTRIEKLRKKSLLKSKGNIIY